MPSSKRGLAVGIAVLTIFLSGCDYDAPLTPKATRRIDSRLLGKWVLSGHQMKEWMTIAAYDESTYVVAYGGDLYRAHHSDVAGLPLVSVQELSGSGKYAYFAWEVHADGKRLTLRHVDKKIVPNGSAAVESIERNRDKPELFKETAEYTREK